MSLEFAKNGKRNEAKQKKGRWRVQGKHQKWDRRPRSEMRKGDLLYLTTSNDNGINM